MALLASLTAALLLAAPGPAPASATPRSRRSRGVGPPTTLTTVKGAGFGPTEVVDRSFDSQPNRKAVTDPSGPLSSPLRLPASALP